MKAQSDSKVSSSRWFWVVVIAFILIKLWLVQGQTLTAQSPAEHDDELFLNLARYLLHGEWLGPYNNLTLAKGPFYPLWIALAFRLSIPLLLSQHLFYAFACLVFTLALRPLLKRHIYLLSVFTILLYNPMSYNDQVMTRVLRDGIYPALTLLVVACVIALLLRRRDSGKSSWIWAVVLGISLAALWLTREEGLWIIPLFFVIWGAGVLMDWKDRLSSRLQRIILWTLPLVIWGVSTGVVSWVNQTYYGVFAKTEFDDRRFVAAYGALTRVKPDQWYPDVPVTKGARERIYKVSPAFAELKPYLEGEIGNRYLENQLNSDANNQEMKGGWFMWVFRDAVAAAGYYSAGKFPVEYYSRLANEVNQACSQGLIQCTPPRASMVQPLRIDYLYPFLDTMIYGSKYITFYVGITAKPTPSTGSEPAMLLYRDLTRERLAGVDELHTYLSGWAFADRAPITLRVWEKDEQLTETIINLQPSQYVYDYFLTQGKDIPNAREARFDISTTCIKDCALEISSEGEVLQRVPIQPTEPRQPPQQISRSGLNLYYYVENSYIEKQSEQLPEQYTSDQFKIRMLNRIGKIYQQVVPLLTILAITAYLLQTIFLLWKRQAWLEWVVCTALGIGIVTRLGLIAMVTITSWQAANMVYLSPVYPLLLGFVCLPLVWVLQQ